MLAALTWSAEAQTAAAAQPNLEASTRQNQPQAPAVVQECAACHGAHGEGNGAGAPRIAAQSSRYILRQLESYANGTRRNAIMEPIAKALSAPDRAALAAYYSQLSPPAHRRTGDVRESSGRGAVLARQGDETRRIQACRNCHGPGGAGEPPLYPYLAGLDANYIVSALNEWRNGTRKNDAGEQMLNVARSLSPEEVVAVAQYYASLPPARPAPLDLVQEAKPATESASGGVQVQEAAPPPDKKVGTEQGAPTTGGTQGRSGVGGGSDGAPRR